MTMDTPELPPKNKTTPFFSGVLVAFFLLSLWSYINHPSIPSSAALTQTPTTFYDQPSLSYTTHTPVHKWDQKRAHWLATNPSFSRSASNRVLMVTGSQHGPCQNQAGDHLLLRLFKNKADYSRIHGYDLFYNNVLLDPKMPGYWAKYPVIRAAMLAHPQADWIYWVDSDAAITDMDFSLPLEKYQDHNLVIHGWPNLVYDKRSWTGLNAGVFLIRNCQWSMDLLDRWTSFGPTSPDYLKWGSILKSIFPDKLYPESDDQTALGYLMVKEGNKWGDKIYLENEYYFEGYWVEIVGKLESVSKSYSEIERKVRRLRRMHGEKGGEDYRAQWEAYFKENNGLRRPFITHFTGCDVCKGKHNPMYTWKKCLDGINKGLNFADNQVLRNYGFVHLDLYNSSSVKPFSFE